MPFVDPELRKLWQKKDDDNEDDDDDDDDDDAPTTTIERYLIAVVSGCTGTVLTALFYCCRKRVIRRRDARNVETLWMTSRRRSSPRDEPRQPPSAAELDPRTTHRATIGRRLNVS